MLQSILSYTFDVAQLSASLERWERMVKQWETSSGKTLDDTLKMGIVIKAMPKESNMSQHLVLNSSRFATYSALRHEMVEILMAQRALQDHIYIEGASSSITHVGAQGKGKGGKASPSGSAIEDQRQEHPQQQERQEPRTEVGSRQL